MTLPELMAELDRHGIELEANGGKLVCKGPADVLNDDVVNALRQRKPEILAMLAAPADRAKCLAAAKDRGHPRVPIRPGESVIPDQSAWERFTANASIADVRIAFDRLEFRNAARARNAGAL